MLSRVAETIYWMGRYLERAEDTARLVQVNTQLVLDLPGDMLPAWEPLLVILGCEEAFAERFSQGTERQIAAFVIGDQDNASSILASLNQARENARTIRETMPREGWEALNDLHHQATRDLASGLRRHGRHAYLDSVIRGVQSLTGLLAGTMNHNTAYDFLNLGRRLERADMTTRVIDVRGASPIPQDALELRPIEDTLWMMMLRSLSGYEMYRQSMQTKVRRQEVLQFLFRRAEFPRSVRYCTDSMVDNLSRLPNPRNAEVALGQLRVTLEQADLYKLNNGRLHGFIDHVQSGLAELHQAIAETYFRAPLQQQQQQMA